MAIEERKQELNRGGTTQRPEKTSPPPKAEPPKDTSILGGKTAIPMSEAAWKIRKSSPYIPGSGGAMLSEQERMEIANELSKKYGGYLEKGEKPLIYKDLYKQLGQAKTGAEKLKVDRKIRWLKDKLGQ